jgi:hypothetical protein
MGRLLVSYVALFVTEKLLTAPAAFSSLIAALRVC